MTCRRSFHTIQRTGAAKNNLSDSVSLSLIFKCIKLSLLLKPVSKIRSPKTFECVVLDIAFRDMQNLQSWEILWLCNMAVCSYRLVSSRKKKSEHETATEMRMFWKLKHYIGVEMQNKLINETAVLSECEQSSWALFQLRWARKYNLEHEAISADL